jgi:hypothetical protein
MLLKKNNIPLVGLWILGSLVLNSSILKGKKYIQSTKSLNFGNGKWFTQSEIVLRMY